MTFLAPTDMNLKMNSTKNNSLPLLKALGFANWTRVRLSEADESDLIFKVRDIVPNQDGILKIDGTFKKFNVCF